MVGNFFQYAIRGIPIGCVFALLAVGLVLNYKTSGVFNLAFAAQAYASAAVFYVVRKEHAWALVPAVIVSVFVVGVVVAVILDRALYRHQRTASPLAKLVTSLGLLVAIPQIVLLFIGNQAKENPPPLWPVKRSDDFLWPHGSRYVLDASQIATLVATVVVVIGLVLLFRRGSMGLRMRAVVESPRLLQLQGIDAERVSLLSWVLSSLLASLAGVLIAPLFAQLDSLDFFTLLVAAIAACVAANLTSIAGAFAAGIGLGVLQAELAGFLPTNSVLANGLRPSLPFVVLFALLILRQSVRRREEVSDPLSGVSPPPPAPPGDFRPRWMTIGVRAFALVVILGGLAVSLFVLGDYWLGLVITGVCLSVILLSVVLTAGVGDTISLCQGTFAAIGAFTAAQLVQHDVPILIAMGMGALVAAVAGLLLGAPIIRLPRIYAALATLAFALFFEGVLVPLGWVSGGATPLTVPRPTILGVSLRDDHRFLILAVVCFAVLGLAVIAIRKGTTGLFLDAVRGSDTAAAAIGVNPARTRLTVFVAGAAIAGFGGGLLVSFNELANYDANFTFFFGLVWLTLVITAGARSVQAAIISGLSFYLVPALLNYPFDTWPSHWLAGHPHSTGFVHSVLHALKPEWALGVAFILFGIGALTYAKHPEGIIEAQTSASIRRIVRVVERLRRRPADVAGGAPPAPVGTVGAP